MPSQTLTWGVPALLIWLMALAMGPMPARAQDQAFQPIDADALVGQCWALSKDDLDSGVTARMQEGTTRTLECFQQEITRQGAAFLTPQAMSEAEIGQTLDEINAAYGRLYWAMYNGHKGCAAGGCGTMHHVLPVLALANLHETILRDLVAQRNEYQE
jgi:hypothetical protein